MKQPKLSLKKDKFNPVFVTRDLLKDDIEIKKELSNFSLNELLRIYSKNSRLESFTSNLIASLILEIIEDGHEIPLPLYVTYTNEFWRELNKKTLTISREEIENLLSNATVKDYIEFTFSDAKIADFSYRVVKKHTFKSNVSCFPAVIFMKMLQDVDFDKVEVTKGIKIFTNPPSIYSGPHNIAILIYTDDKKRIQYIDIVDNPTIDMKGYIEN
ncbi:hypothetical protein [Flavobacterium sp.]|uniref:hypothetical protein n=1 Tax=Flavobacterium sp. TaxID=239 RepID=UPI0026296F1D|nr:hypothetical protein [Flavobacterium sp.]